MKIAIHQPRISYYSGGGERVPLEQAKQLCRLGHEIFIVTTKPKKKSKLYSEFLKDNPEIRIVYFDLEKTRPDIYKIKAGRNQKRWDEESISFGKLTRRFYLNNDFDLVAVHYTADALMIPLKQKTILHLHGCPARKRIIDKKSLDRADCLIGVAKFVNDYWRKIYQSDKKIELTYNGIDNKKFYHLSYKKNYDIFFVGRFIKIKGIDDLIRAIAIAKKTKPKIKVVIAGEGPEKNRLIALAKKLNLGRNIEFAGFVSDSKLVKFYNASKICVFPSSAKEAVLTTMLEAAACGGCVITTDCCGMPEFIKNGRNGFLVEPKSPQKLAKAILRLLNNDALRERISKQALDSIKKSWEWEKRIKKLENIYKLCQKKK